MASDHYVGVDIGGTKCAAVLGAWDGTSLELLGREQFATSDTRSPMDAIGEIEKRIISLLSVYSLDTAGIKAIGISCGGPLDSARGVIQSPPNLIGWDDVHISDELESRLGIKCALQNDANAGAMAEWLFGAARGAQNAVFLTFGTGFGAGLILDGKLYGGTNDMAGEIGHVRLSGFGPVGYGKSGSVEGFCSGGGIRQLAQSMALERLQSGRGTLFCDSIGALNDIDVPDVAQAARQGDETALSVFKVSGRKLGSALSLLIDLLNPEVIVIGSIFVRCHDLIWPHARKVIEAETLPRAADACRVVPAELNENTGDYAALSIAVTAG